MTVELNHSNGPIIRRMARRKGASKSNDSDQGWRNRQRQNEAHNRKINANEVSEASMSSTVSSQESHANSAVECQKNTHKESSPPNIFNNSSGLKYLHKKFKRVASAVIEDICDKVKTNADSNQNQTTIAVVESALKKGDAITISHNLNGETLNVAAVNAVAIVTAAAATATATATATAKTTADVVANVQSHINESETNSQDFVVKCIQCRKSLDDQQQRFCNECNPELINASAKYGHGVLRNQFSSKRNVMGADLRSGGGGGGGGTTTTTTSILTAAAAVAAATTTTTSSSAATSHQAYKQYEIDFLDSLSKCKNDSTTRIMTVSPLQQKTNYEYESYAADYRTKNNTIADNVPQNFKENLLRGTQLDLTVQTLNASTSSKNTMGSNSASASNKSSIRRKNGDRPWICATCGMECKSKGLLYKHCRSANHGMFSFHNPQLPNEDVELDISQSTSSDLELSSCSTTTNSDAISRSTTPPEEAQSTSFGSYAVALNYSTSSHGLSAGGHSIASLTAPDRPYKPKFHKAVYYQSNANINNSTNSISQGDDSKPRALIKSKHVEVINENASSSHPSLSTQSVEYLKEHISKIISQNAAIMEGVEPALQKKYHKITGIPRGTTPNVTNATEMQQQPQSQPHTSAVTPVKKVSDEMLSKLCEYPELNAMDALKNSHRPFPTLQQQAQQALKKSHSNTPKNYTALNLSSEPLNLTNTSIEAHRKKSTGNDSMHRSSPVPSTSNTSDPNTAPQSALFESNHHPQNPERSIIKSLLLNSRGLAVPTAGEGEDAVYTCPLCNISFRSADNLQYHTKCYCQGTPQVSLPLPNQANGSPHSAPISPVGSPSHKYFRSNSFNLYRSDTKYSPNTLAKLASSTLRHHRTPLSLAKLAAQQAAGYYLNKPSPNANALYPASATAMSGSAGSSSSGCGASSSSRSGPDNFKPCASNSSTSPSSFSTVTTEAQSVSSQCVQITKQLMDASLPSPGPLLGKTRLVDHYNTPRTSSKVKDSATLLSKTIDAIVTPTESALSLVDASKLTPSKDQTNVPMGEEPFTPRSQKLLQMCGGDVTIVEKTEEKVPRFGSSGGSIVSISSSPDTMPESSPLSIRSGLLSGGSIIEAIPAKRKSSTTSVSSSPGPTQQILPNLSRLNSGQGLMANYFQFPTPINSITAYNPLTLPPKQPEFNADLPAAIEATKIMHGGKIIPFVPGIPGPNSLSANAPLATIIPQIPPEKCSERIFSPSQSASLYASNMALVSASPYRAINLAMPMPIPNSVHAPKRSKSPESPPKLSANKPQLSSQSSDNSPSTSHLHSSSMTSHHMWAQSQTNREPTQTTEKPFNFMRIAENLSPPKSRLDSSSSTKSHGNLEVSVTNLDKLKPRPKPLIQVPEVLPLHINIESAGMESTSTIFSSSMNSRSGVETTPEKVKTLQLNVESEKNTLMPSKPPPKFLRPCSLALKPGTFTPKKHHGITPTANTLPLISPETPRPSKHCVQLYLNGHAYTYLGLKCSTKTFYCTLNRPQPVYAVFAGRRELSMYSNWQTCAENNPHPLGFTPKESMSLYDSRQRTHINHQGSKYTTSNKLTLSCTPSDRAEQTTDAHDTKDDIKTTIDDNMCVSSDSSDNVSTRLDDLLKEMKNNVQNLSTVPGGYKSNEDYTYVRGRGRGRYVCIECGMRCIKPCTLKKHIRTVHSDVRPFTCRHCMFSFKTKGNLTKHMESKAHYKKCVEKGINPHTPIEDSVHSEEDRLAMTATGTNLSLPTEDGDTVSDDCSDGDDLEIDMESSDNEDAKLPDHEAAHCLLSLSQRSPSEEMHISPKSLISATTITYPYNQSDLTNVTVPKLQSTLSEFNVNQAEAFNKTDSIISKMGVNLPNDLSTAASSKALKDCKPKRANMTADVIDLSKPRSVVSTTESRESDCRTTTAISYSGAAELLKSLMTLSDKVPAISPPAFDLNLGPVTCNGQQSNLTNNQHLQTYLTERALQKSKMKLSQVHVLNAFDEKSGHKFMKEPGTAFFSMLSKKLDHIEISPKPRSVIMANQEIPRTDNKATETKPKHEQNVPEIVTDEDQPMKEEDIEKMPSDSGLSQIIESGEKNAVKIELHIAKPCDETLDLAKNINDHSGMETLAEIAANSMKLDASKSVSESTVSIQAKEPTPNTTNASTIVGSGKTSPKSASLPSESASKKEISAKNIASEYLKLANEQDAAVDESSASSDSDAMAESDSKHVRRSSMMSLGPDVLISARTVVVGEDGFKSKSSNANDLPMVAHPRGNLSNNTSRTNVAFIQEDGGPSRCTMCSASFPKSHQLVLHMNIHYMNPERKFRCNSCGINFHTQGRLQKHMRSETHNSKVNMVETQGSSTSKNPRPFECSDCNRAFRIHGHLAKHLRSKTHVQKLECLQKLPFGTYAMIEEARINLTDIDTTDCDNSLASLKALAEKLKVESSSPEKRKALHDSLSNDSTASTGTNKDVTQLTNESNTDKNTGCLIKKRKLNDGCTDALTISEGDEN